MIIVLFVDHLWITCGLAVDDLWSTGSEPAPRLGLLKTCLQTQHIGLFLCNDNKI